MMRTFKRAVFALLLFASAMNIQAQVRSGYMIGLNLSSMKYSTKGVSISPETWPGIHFGGLFELPLSGRFTLQPGALFSAKGSGYTVDSTRFSISPIFIEVPVRAACYFGSGKVKLLLFAGPFFAIGIDGMVIESSGAQSIRFGSGYNKDMKPFDMGFVAGLGVNVGGLLITAQYSEGIMNMAPVISDGSEMRSSVIGISLASLFSSRR